MANQEVLCHSADDRWSFTRGTFAVKRFPMPQAKLPNGIAHLFASACQCGITVIGAATPSPALWRGVLFVRTMNGVFAIGRKR